MICGRSMSGINLTLITIHIVAISSQSSVSLILMHELEACFNQVMLVNTDLQRVGRTLNKCRLCTTLSRKNGRVSCAMVGQYLCRHLAFRQPLCIHIDVSDLPNHISQGIFWWLALLSMCNTVLFHTLKFCVSTVPSSDDSLYGMQASQHPKILNQNCQQSTQVRMFRPYRYSHITS